MMQKTIICAAALVAAAFTSQAQEKFLQYNVKAAAVDEIEVSEAIKVEYTPSAKVGVTVKVPQELKPYLVVKVDNGQLEAHYKGNFPNNKFSKLKSKTLITVTAPAVRDFEASTAASITVKAPLNLPDAEVSVECSTAASFNAPSGIACSQLEADSETAGSINIKGVKAKVVKAEAGTAGNVTLEGSAGNVDFSASTSGNVSAGALKAYSGRVTADTAGNVKCNVRSIVADKSTGGSISNAR